MENAYQNDTLFSRWLSGALSESERQHLEKHPDFSIFRGMLEAKGHQQLSDSEIRKLWKNFTAARHPDKRKDTHQHWLWRGIAATGLLTLGLIGWSLFQPAPTPSSLSATATGEYKTVHLPDGSTVRLNAVSSAEVVMANWAKERRVRLIGEGFFQVNKSPVPFVVETSAGTVSVLGTSFNVRYRGRAFEVACYTGLVQATTSEGHKQALRAGQKAWALNGRWQPLSEVVDSWPAWIQGESRFGDVPVYEVFAELERQYNITISASGTEGRQFSGTFIHGDLNLALRMVCEPLGLQYETEGRQILIRRKAG